MGIEASQSTPGSSGPHLAAFVLIVVVPAVIVIVVVLLAARAPGERQKAGSGPCEQQRPAEERPPADRRGSLRLVR